MLGRSGYSQRVGKPGRRGGIGATAAPSLPRSSRASRRHSACTRVKSSRAASRQGFRHGSSRPCPATLHDRSSHSRTRSPDTASAPKVAAGQPACLGAGPFTTSYAIPCSSSAFCTRQHGPNFHLVEHRWSLTAMRATIPRPRSVALPLAAASREGCFRSHPARAPRHPPATCTLERVSHWRAAPLKRVLRLRVGLCRGEPAGGGRHRAVSRNARSDRPDHERQDARKEAETKHAVFA
jgi:hypothetical protein